MAPMAQILLCEHCLSAHAHRRLVGSLPAAGHAGWAGEDAEKVLTVAATAVPDVLITEWKLGSRLDGIDLARKVRAGNRDLKVILFASLPDAARLMALHRAVPVFRVLQKPLAPSQVLDAVDDALGPF